MESIHKLQKVFQWNFINNFKAIFPIQNFWALQIAIPKEDFVSSNKNVHIW